MFCNNCGTELPTGSRFCHVCGTAIEQETGSRSYAQPESHDAEVGFQNSADDGREIVNADGIVRQSTSNARMRRIRCPECGSRNLQATTETDVKVSGGKGFSGGNACLGWLLLGPFGLLCGNCGRTQASARTTNKSFWICGNCGHKFRNLDELEAELVKMRKSTPIIKWVSIGVGAFSALMGFAIFSIREIAGLGVLFLLMAALMIWIGLSSPKWLQSKEDEFARLQRDAITYEPENE